MKKPENRTQEDGVAEEEPRAKSTGSTSTEGKS